jgi:hypothetical protein
MSVRNRAAIRFLRLNPEQRVARDRANRRQLDKDIGQPSVRISFHQYAFVNQPNWARVGAPLATRRAQPELFWDMDL